MRDLESRNPHPHSRPVSVHDIADLADELDVMLNNLPARDNNPFGAVATTTNAVTGDNNPFGAAPRHAPATPPRAPVPFAQYAAQYVEVKGGTHDQDHDHDHDHDQAQARARALAQEQAEPTHQAPHHPGAQQQRPPSYAEAEELGSSSPQHHSSQKPRPASYAILSAHVNRPASYAEVGGLGVGGPARPASYAEVDDLPNTTASQPAKPTHGHRAPSYAEVDDLPNTTATQPAKPTHRHRAPSYAEVDELNVGASSSGKGGDAGDYADPAQLRAAERAASRGRPGSYCLTADAEPEPEPGCVHSSADMNDGGYCLLDDLDPADAAAEGGAGSEVAPTVPPPRRVLDEQQQQQQQHAGTDSSQQPNPGSGGKPKKSRMWGLKNRMGKIMGSSKKGKEPGKASNPHIVAPLHRFKMAPNIVL